MLAFMSLGTHTVVFLPGSLLRMAESPPPLPTIMSQTVLGRVGKGVLFEKQKLLSASWEWGTSYGIFGCWSNVFTFGNSFRLMHFQQIKRSLTLNSHPPSKYEGSDGERSQSFPAVSLLASWHIPNPHSTTWIMLSHVATGSPTASVPCLKHIPKSWSLHGKHGWMAAWCSSPMKVSNPWPTATSSQSTRAW